MNINFGEYGQAVQALQFGLTYMSSIFMFGISLLSWLTLSLGLSWASYLIAKFLNSFGIFSTPANTVAGQHGFYSDDERWEFADMMNDLDNSMPIGEGNWPPPMNGYESDTTTSW